jgi:hypothetical protein
MLISNGYIPKITLPTRLTKNSSTLLDNFLCKTSHDYNDTVAGILMNNLSDHQPYFLCFNKISTGHSGPQHIWIKNQNERAIADYKTYIVNANIMQTLETHTTDPNLNYNKLSNILETGLQQCMPLRKVKFDKHKHKKTKWITSGIIRSINFRDRLHMKLRKTDVNNAIYDTLATNLKTYNKILKKLIREAKKNYYMHKLEKFKHDIKNTWIVIKDILSKNTNNHQFPAYMREGKYIISKK